jgi:hypothetical protein
MKKAAFKKKTLPLNSFFNSPFKDPCGIFKANIASLSCFKCILNDSLYETAKFYSWVGGEGGFLSIQPVSWYACVQCKKISSKYSLDLQIRWK